MADIRIKDLAVTASSSASDDYLAVDGSTNGTRKLSAYSPTFGGNLTVNGAAAVNGGNAVYGGGAVLLGGTGGGSGNGVYTTDTGSPTMYMDHRGTDNTGDFYWRNGTGGANTRMTLSGSGNLLIGTTTSTGEKLQVSGTAYVSGNTTFGGNLTATASNKTLTIDNITNYGQNLVVNAAGSLSLILQNNGSATLTLDSSQNATFAGNVKAASVYAEKTGAGLYGRSVGNIEQATTVNSTTYTVTTSSAKVFVVQLASGDAALCYTSYKSSTITILGSDGTIVNSASPSSTQLGISKSANSHDILFTTGSNALAGGYGGWGFCFLGNPVTSIA